MAARVAATGTPPLQRVAVVSGSDYVDNLLLDARGNLKLGDFGLARKAERLWTIIGTPEYTAPEVLRFVLRRKFAGDPGHC